MNLKTAGILGMGTYVPEKIMTNFDFEKIVDTSDEWIRSRSGIEERRFVSDEQACSDLAAEAAKKAIAAAGMQPDEIEMIILATCTPDYLIQNTSCIVQKKIGAIHAAAFDIHAACSGFVYGLTMASGLIRSGMYKKILVIGSEALSRVLDMEDRNTCILFGDGAAAAVVGEVEPGYGILSSYIKAEGEDEEILRMPAGGTKRPATMEEVQNRETFLKMKGPEVFKFAIQALPKATLEALKLAEKEPKDLHMVFPHQANKRIIESSAKRLKLPVEKFYMNLNKYGNTSAASIGIALGEALEKGLVKKGDLIALTGFGAGLTYGSVVIKWAY